MTKAVFLWIGIEFFVLQSLRSHYPRYRRLFNIIDWLLWGVPNDAEYAMEVIRLHRQAEELMPQKESKNRPWRRSADLDKVPEVDENPVTTSTAATLAIMVAGAAAGQVKYALDEQFERARLRDAKAHEESDSSDGGGHSSALKASSSSNSLFERKASRGSRSEEESEIHETYGCIYKGNIPGRILLTTNGLQFRTSRVTGAKVLVYYYWQDIVSVRKSKSINVFVWHTNGLDITTVDGEELHFDNVIKRDDCFNKLVAAAGDRWR
ncbi:hypothetical protein BJV82DRAFT_638741 [Fennellomyces sp. T-0311]|nr:hypothetical protein BJV82DRAFT_638741 [Fennellomyces sp. T-0311]